MLPKVAIALTALFLASCASPLARGRRDYRDAIQDLRRDPVAARDAFAEAEPRFREALADPELKLHERVSALSFLARCLMELDRFAEAHEVARTKVDGFSPTLVYPGDGVGLALLRASHLDPERGFAELLIAEREAPSDASRLFVIWEQAQILAALGTPKARAEAAKLCDQHPSRPEFAELKKTLAP